MVSADSRGTARPMAPRVDAAAPTATPGPASTGAPGPDAPLVLVGTPDEDVGKKLREALESWGLRAAIVADGVDTMLEIQRQLPAAVVLAPTLPRMYGFQVCEIIKRNESLQRIGVILLGAIHHPDRYRRPPGELYGADAYVEEPDLPEALFSELRQLGVMARPAEARPGGDVTAPRPESPGAPAGVPAPLAPGPAQPDPGRAPEPTLADEPRAPSEMAASASSEPSDELSDARAQAERLARIIVSDIVLYNEDKFAAAIEAGTVAESLGPDLEEGRGLFRDRVDARVQHEKDFLTEELLRVARTRAMQ
jgi:CheY-like chemotaxis protein